MTNATLAKVPFFAGLGAAKIEAISKAIRQRGYQKGTLIHASGAMGGDLYIIELGRVTVKLPSERGEELALRLLGPGDFFGEVSLLDDEPWYGDALATDDCQLLLLAKRDFLDILERYPSVARRLLTIICKRLRHNARLAQDLAFLDVPTRLARALVTLAEHQGWGWMKGDEQLPESRLLEITQNALAAHVGATRESVNKWLGYYERRGYLSRERDGIALLQLEELRARAETDRW